MRHKILGVITFTLLSANCYADFTLEANKKSKYIQVDYGHKVERTGFVCDFDSFDKHFKLARVKYSYVEEGGIKTWKTIEKQNALSIDDMRMAHVLFCKNKT